MPCYHPISAFQCADGSIVFHERRWFNTVKNLSLPCGQCIGCRLERSRQWAMRCVHEAQMHEENCFITLTYNNENLPHDNSLHHDHFQRFIKRLRKGVSPKLIRYYMAGEYGEQFGRPHYHACIFGHQFKDKKIYKKTDAGSLIYTSEELASYWQARNPGTGKYESIGYSSVGDVTFESAAYVARYIMKKVTGQQAEQHYKKTDEETGEIIIKMPEYNKMSLKPGIGANWLKRYQTDVYPHDYVIINGKKVKPPKYYDKKYKTDNPYEFDEILYNREKNGKLNSEDNTLERLKVKETVQQAKLQKLKRNLT